MAQTAPASGGPSPGLSGRQVGAFVALWLGWAVGFGLAQTSIDALIRSRMPNPAAAAMLFVAAMAALWLGARLWPGWRGALGLISIVFAVFAAIVGLVRRAPVAGGETARPVTSLAAIVCSVLGSIAVGAVLLRAERLRRGTGRRHRT